MLNFKDLLEIVNSEVSRLDIGNEPTELYDPIRYSLETGGKRIRPVLTLAACNLFLDDVKKAIYPAMAIEIFHNFTLLHDDIMDKAELRRNMPTVHKKWNQNIAILSGDAMMIKAYQQIIKSPSYKLVQIVELFNQTAIEVCEGQQLDMNFEWRKKVSEEEYIEMIRLKTSVLLASSLKIGALVAAADSADCNSLYDFGLNLGLSFQLQDDYLDAYGDPAKFGKKPGGDILADKKTYLLVKAMEIASGNDLQELNKLFDNKENIDPEFKVTSAIKIFDKLNIKKIVRDKMDFYYNNAMHSLSLVRTDEEKKLPLIEFAKNLMNRES